MDVPPVCMYSSRDGFPTSFHIAYLGQFALHGAGAIMAEASGVSPEGPSLRKTWASTKRSMWRHMQVS